MLHTLLLRVLTWAQRHNVQVEAGAWEEAVAAVHEPVIPANMPLTLHALFELMDGILEPTVVAWGACTREHLGMNALS